MMRTLQVDRSSFGRVSLGIEMAGIGCPLEEWDAVVATMPESVRPSVRGAHSAAFERAYRTWQRAQPAPGTAAPGPAEVAAIASRERRSHNQELAQRIIAAVAHEALPPAHIYTRVTTAGSVSNVASVKTTIYRLVLAGALVRVGRRTSAGYHYAAARRATAVAAVARAAHEPAAPPRRVGLKDIVLSALMDRPRTMRDLDAALPEMPPVSVRQAVYRLLALKQVVHYGPRVPHGGRASVTQQAYAIAPQLWSQVRRLAQERLAS